VNGLPLAILLLGVFFPFKLAHCEVGLFGFADEVDAA
jgi:hypothetical protein